MGGSGSRLLLPVPGEGAASMDTYKAPPDSAARLDDTLLWMIDTAMSTGCAYSADGGDGPVALMVPVLPLGGGAAAGDGAMACRRGGNGAGARVGSGHGGCGRRTNHESVVAGLPCMRRPMPINGMRARVRACNGHAHVPAGKSRRLTP